jgi:hypothetical protein
MAHEPETLLKYQNFLDPEKSDKNKSKQKNNDYIINFKIQP